MITGPKATLKLARKLRSEMSLPEALLWRHLRTRPGGLKFRRQHPAGIYVLDFYCAAARLAIEVDGFSHEAAAVARKDLAKSAYLRSQRIATLRVPAKVVLNEPERAITRILEVCRARMAGQILPHRGRGTTEGGGGARAVRPNADPRASEEPHVPLHHPADGPPPPKGEE